MWKKSKFLHYNINSNSDLNSAHMFNYFSKLNTVFYVNEIFFFLHHNLNWKFGPEFSRFLCNTVISPWTSGTALNWRIRSGVGGAVRTAVLGAVWTVVVRAVVTTVWALSGAWAVIWTVWRGSSQQGPGDTNRSGGHTVSCVMKHIF